MPSGFAALKSVLPSLDSNTPVEVRLQKISNCLHMLVRELQYALSSIDLNRDVNKVSREIFAGTISKPMMSSLVKLEKSVDTFKTETEEKLEDFSYEINTQKHSLLLLWEEYYTLHCKISVIENAVDEIRLRVDGIDSLLQVLLDFVEMAVSHAEILTGLVEGLTESLQEETETRAAAVASLEARVLALEGSM